MSPGSRRVAILGVGVVLVTVGGDGDVAVIVGAVGGGVGAGS